MATATLYDCQRCGACCCNPASNRAEGFSDYIEIARDDRLLAQSDLVRRYVVCNADGTPHLRLDPAGRCLALRGAIGRQVRCLIYHHRPSPCRRVQAGSELCQKYRVGAGLTD